MKLFKIFLLFLFSTSVFAQSSPEGIYRKAIRLYNAKDYASSAKEFDKITNLKLSDRKLYDGACIFSLNDERQKALKMLTILANERGYSNFSHISTDSDLKNLHSAPEWNAILKSVKANFESYESTKLSRIYNELVKAKRILQKDNGKLWNDKIWTDKILILDYDNTIYSISQFPDSKTDDGKLYFAKVPKDTFVFVNTVQKYKGEDYAVVLSNYINDDSATIIHELFHVLQFKYAKFDGTAVKYLDNYDAREWLRLEFQALRNCLDAIDHKKKKSEISQYLEDALRYRKLRQTKYKVFLEKELELETLEGLANYTGFKLSTMEDI
ncbi:MAG: hypothetical protein ACK5NT_00795, partial [Pyrinomonadaceae bacterium]